MDNTSCITQYCSSICELFDWEQITSRNGRVNLCVCSAFLLQTHVMETSSPIPYRLEPVEIEVIKVDVINVVDVWRHC